MKTALVGPNTNHKIGDIIDTEEGARWIAFGIAEAIESETLETAAVAPAKETATRRRTKVTK